MIFLTHAGWRELHNLVWLSVWVPLTYQGGEVTFTTNRWRLTHSDYSHCVTDCVFVLKDRRSAVVSGTCLTSYRRWQTRCDEQWCGCTAVEKNSLSPQNIWWTSTVIHISAVHSVYYGQYANTFFLTHFSWLDCMYKGLRHFSCRLQLHYIYLTIYDKQIVHKGSIRHFFNVFEGSLAHQACFIQSEIK